MLRISIIRVGLLMVYKLEGDLAGEWVNEFREAWFRAPSGSRKNEFVDLDSVNRIDREGMQLLSLMGLAGVRFVASAPYTRSLLEEFGEAVYDELPAARS